MNKFIIGIKQYLEEQNLIFEENRKVFRLNMFEGIINQINQLDNNDWFVVNKEQLKKIYEFDPKIPWIKNKQLVIFKR